MEHYSANNSLVSSFAGSPCPYCLAMMSGAVQKQPTRDHVIPKSKGGSNDVSNIAIVCRKCNHDKADSLMSEFYARLLAAGDIRYGVIAELMHNAYYTNREALADFYAEAGLSLIRTGVVPRKKRDRSKLAHDIAWSTMQRLKVPKTHWGFYPPATVRIVARAQVFSLRCDDPHRFPDKVGRLLGIEVAA